MYDFLFVNLLAVIFVLCFRMRFPFLWVGVVILRLGTSEVSAICSYDWFSIYLFLLSAWIFDNENRLAGNSLCESRNMLLEQCLKQCLWMVISQIVFWFLKLALSSIILSQVGLCWPFTIVIMWFTMRLVFYFIPLIIRISKSGICDFLL